MRIKRRQVSIIYVMVILILVGIMITSCILQPPLDKTPSSIPEVEESVDEELLQQYPDDLDQALQEIDLVFEDS